MINHGYDTTPIGSAPPGNTEPPQKLRWSRKKWPRRAAIGVGLVVVFGVGVAIGAAGHSTGVSQARYKASQAQASSLRGQVSGLQAQVSTDNAAVATARTTAATAQQTANANAAAAYQSKQAALQSQQQTVAGEQQTLKQELGEVQANTISSDGTFVVGQDIKPGTYHTNGSGNAGANDCYYATLNSTDGSLTSIIANGNFDGPETISLSGVYAFQANGGCTWNLVP
jgi:hypothetical protein